MSFPLYSSFLVIKLVLLISVQVSASNSVAKPTHLKVTCLTRPGYYTLNSTFKSNLDLLLHSLTSNGAVHRGYYYDRVGNASGFVNGHVLCRGDVDNVTCQTCLDAAAKDLFDLCELNKGALIWYDDCFLRYTTSNFRSNVANELRAYMKDDYIKTSQNVSDWNKFNRSLTVMLDDLAEYAAFNVTAPRPLMFATGEMEYVSKEIPRVYAFAQCTRDLSGNDCLACLKEIIQDLPNCCAQRNGGRVLAASCSFRYEVYKFYNGTTRISIPATVAVWPPLALPPSNQFSFAGKKNRAVRTIVAVSIPLAAIGTLIAICCCSCYLKRKGTPSHYRRAGEEEIYTVESLLFDLSTVKNATDDFSESNKLGEGGCGAVYKGTLSDGQLIAVKRLLRESGQGVQELKNEILLLAKLQHRNLVRLLGVCMEEHEKLLIYEYVQNNSLETVLFDPIKKEQLCWARRYTIIGGIARAMLYLHEESQIKIIHRDLKASNILLDANMNPKISDFGLAKFFEEDQTQAVTSRVAGTFGYMAPEYVTRGQFSNKSDVFSFGILVMEIVTGRKNSSFFNSLGSPGLLNYVWQHWSNGTTSEVIDPSLLGNYLENEVSRCIQIGLMCVQESPADRPTMSSVVTLLTSCSSSIELVSPPAFIFEVGSSGSRQDYYHASSDHHHYERRVKEFSKKTTSSIMYSRNDLSVTEFYPR